MELPIPYKSQWDEDAKLANGDCTQTCLAMYLSWALNHHILVDILTKAKAEKMGEQGDFINLKTRGKLTTLPEIKTILDYFSIPSTKKNMRGRVEDSENLIASGIPHIAIISYKDLDDKWKEDKDFDGWHSVLVIGADSCGGHDGASKYYIINDPDRFHDKGKLIIPSNEFECAWSKTNYLAVLLGR